LSSLANSEGNDSDYEDANDSEKSDYEDAGLIADDSKDLLTDDEYTLKAEDELSVTTEEDRGNLPDTQTVDATDEDVKGDGNCFFYSIHAALKDNGLLVKACAQLGIDQKGVLDDPLKFSNRFREYLSNSDELFKELEMMFDYLCELSYDKETTRQVISSLSNQYIKLLSGIFLNEDIVKKACSANNKVIKGKLINLLKGVISVDKVYASAPDVSVTKEILKKCGIFLDIKSRIIKRLRPYNNRIVLYNQNNIHYKWFKLAYRKGGRTRRHRRKITKLIKTIRRQKAGRKKTNKRKIGRMLKSRRVRR
jgi:hypothetical protein